MARLVTATGVTVEVSDEKAERLIGVDYQPEKKAPAPAVKAPTRTTTDK